MEEKCKKTAKHLDIWQTKMRIQRNVIILLFLHLSRSYSSHTTPRIWIYSHLKTRMQ